MTPRVEPHNLDGQGTRDHKVYDMPLGPPVKLWPNRSDTNHREYWPAVTDVPCPVDGCSQSIVWYEAGYVPGYRVCMARAEEPGTFDRSSIQHRFLAGGTAEQPTLILDDDEGDV